MLPTPRLYLLLLLGTAIGFVLAWLGGTEEALHRAIALTLVYDLVLLLLAWLDGAQVRPYRVQVSRQPLQTLSIGRDNPIALTVKSGDRPAKLRIRDTYPATFVVTPAICLLVLPAHAQTDLIYTVFPKQRGEYAWGDIQVRQLGAWGLSWHDWKIPQQATAEVYPDLIGLRQLSIRLTLESSGNIRRARRMGTGTEFAELREYNTGDDLRLIDWKATARRDRLLVRVLEPEQEQTLIILLDRGRLMTAQVGGLARFDWGLNATLALALAGIRRGDRVGVGVFDRQMHTWIPPERGQPHLAKLLERLTPIQPDLLEPDYLAAVTTATAHQARRALVVLLTDLVDETASGELLAAMGRLSPRYLPFCVTLRDPEVDRQANTPTEEVATAYCRAVALDLLAQRQVALAKLKQKGVLVLDAPAPYISESLVDRYLQIKARSQL
ncbi:MAG TPA: DUF58 domain-containing protein [Synechococcales cyanobacterium M55_K2018_004]|nr:DUF58 domain-containing protein [Synechococcales cyanobacterium M55_K2018_004]